MSSTKPDITNEADIKLMVDTFYQKVNADEMLGPVFNDFAKVDWTTHLPKMYNFWGKLLFGTGDYAGSPFAKHIPLPINTAHFTRWVALFVENVDEHFAGDVAEQAKARATNIGTVFAAKKEFLNSQEGS